jgi:thiamine biosynthesis lipoprotein
MHVRELAQTRQALGGDVTLAFVTDASPKEIERIFNKLWRQVFMFERRFSRFLPMSELSTFNRSAGLKTFITPEFKDLLTKAKGISIKTDGFYNPFILPALQRAGYVKSAVSGYENDAQEDFSKRQVVSVDNLTIDESWASIPYGTALDLGGCGKGYLADLLGEILTNEPVEGYWLSIGGDIATLGHDERDNNISLSIQDANDTDNVTNWTVFCPSGHSSTATSGTFNRKTQNADKNWHHSIDPRTLQPAVTDIRLATVCASTVIEADVLASCAVILGSKKAPSFLKKHGVRAALLQCADDEGRFFIKKFGKYIKKGYSQQPKGVFQNA